MKKWRMVLALLVVAILALGKLAFASVWETNYILVNKEHALPADYVPSDLSYPDVAYASGVQEERKQMRAEAARALESMFAAALKDGVELLGISGYRSYQTQSAIYERRLSEMGATYVSQYIAKPGESEHQTGLAMDLGCPGCTDLSERFRDTAAFTWLASHAHEYGFVIRYPRGGEAETGYAFEPWHVRYLGEEAEAVLQSGQTYETYIERKYFRISFLSLLKKAFGASDQ